MRVALALAFATSACSAGSSGDAQTLGHASSGPAGTGAADAGDRLPTPDVGSSADDGSLVHECDVALQDCPDGKKCAAYAPDPGECCVDQTHCVDDEGDGVFGDRCYREQYTDDCAPGYFCLTNVPYLTGEGSCIETCSFTGEAPCEDDSFSCLPVTADFAACIKFCHPYELSSCPEILDEVGCYRSFDGFFICSPPGHEEDEGRDGDSCQALNHCQIGLSCVESSTRAVGACVEGADRCCTAVCDIEDESPCSHPDESCVRLYEEGAAIPGFETLGMCGVPQ